MVEIQVKSEHTYQVKIGLPFRESLEKILTNHHKTLIIAPRSLQVQLDLHHSDVFYTEDGEAQKDIATVIEIWKILGEKKYGRKDAIVGIGGGATTDLAGFVAATWLRGIDWYAIPTTLAAMVDAAVGGKTGINTSSGKNLVGSFHSPQEVIIDSEFLETLSDRDFSAGLAEVIKTGIIADVTILESLNQVRDLSGARAIAHELIAKSVRVKAGVVSDDFKEGRLREILNFGHTFGHAIEKREKYALRHGEAVAIGLIYALYLSESQLDLDPAFSQSIKELLLKFSLPVGIGDIGFAELFSLMQGDKKSRSEELRFIGVDQVAHPVWLESVPESIAREVYDRIIQ